MLVILKIKSIKQPNKVWDNHNHFLMANHDRMIMKKYEKAKPNSNEQIEFNTLNFRSVFYLTENKKELIHIYFGTEKLWDFDWKYHWKSHIDIGVWEVETILKEKVELPVNKNLDKKHNSIYDWSIFDRWDSNRSRKIK
tara:strand:+ start:327 stop:743 length:417 start_codon:yes stop_codon:yes gene_type:complete